MRHTFELNQDPILNWKRIVSESILRYPIDSEEIVIYFALSGETHYLNVVELEALMALRQDIGMTFSEWQEALAKRLSIEVDDRLTQYLEELAPQMEEYGLIDSVSP